MRLPTHTKATRRVETRDFTRAWQEGVRVFGIDTAFYRMAFNHNFVLLDGQRLTRCDAQLLFDTVLLAVAVFFLFMLMSYLLFNPARKLLKDRQDRIESDINTAVADKESAAALKAEYEGKLKDIDKEAEAILTEARQKALKNQNKIVDDAKEEASRIIKRASEEAELEKKHAMDDMKQEMIQIASLMAQKAVAASITTDIQDTLVEETLKEMGESTWLS